MKRLFLATLVALAATFCGFAQKTPHAFGVHFGGATMDLEYQYHFNRQNFLDVTVGAFDLDKGFCGQAVYDWNIKEWSDWTPDFATWKFWGGFGGGLGIYDAGGNSKTELFLGPVGVLGFGFTPKLIPLTIGVDYRPMIALNVGDSFRIIDAGFRNIGVTMTYRF